MKLSPRWIAITLWVILAIVVPISCVSCSHSTRDPSLTGLLPPTNDLSVASKDEADLLIEVFYEMQIRHLKGPILRHSDFANTGLAAVAEELKKRDIAFEPQKIEYSIYNHKSQAIFREEFHRAEKLSEKAGFLEHELIFAAMAAILKSFNETHTSFYYPADFGKPKSPKSDSTIIYGIGVMIHKHKDEFFYIGKLVPRGSAEKAGLKRFDRITKVDGDPVGDDLGKLCSRIVGLEGTIVDLTIERAGKEMKFTMVRRPIGELTADTEMVVEENGDRWSYVRFHHFDPVAMHTINELNHDPGIFGTTVDGVILDLRGNPGGHLDVLDQFLSYFLKKGSIAFVIKGKDGKDIHVAMTDPIFHERLVVMVDENSSSAAEMFAYAIQANGRGTIVGSKTTGFIGVGNEISLSYGAEMMITVARVLDHKGNDLEYVGVTPDVVVEITREDILDGRDRQLEKAWEILKGK